MPNLFFPSEKKNFAQGKEKKERGKKVKE